MASLAKLKVYHIPVCPFSQRLEILLALKGVRDEVEFEVVDITRPRPPELLAKLKGSTSLPALETTADDGSMRVVKESIVIMNMLEDLFRPPVRQTDHARQAVETELIKAAEGFTMAG